MVQAPNTIVRMSHALTLRAKGRTIGAIHSWSPSQRRAVDSEYEVEPNATGMPRDLVPQLVEGREVRVSRYDTYPEIMEEVFGDSELVVLTDQFRPFTIRETWKGPGTSLSQLSRAAQSLGNVATSFTGNSNNGVQQGAADLAGGLNRFAAQQGGNEGEQFGRMLVSNLLASATASVKVYEYQGCWFTDVGRTLDAKTDRVVSVEATLIWTNKVRVL